MYRRDYKYNFFLNPGPLCRNIRTSLIKCVIITSTSSCGLLPCGDCSCDNEFVALAKKCLELCMMLIIICVCGFLKITKKLKSFLKITNFN